MFKLEIKPITAPKILLMLAITMIGVSFASAGDTFTPCKTAHAAQTSDFCYNTQIIFKNPDTTTLTGIPARIAMPAPQMIAANTMNKYGNDIYLVNPSNQERIVLAQGLNAPTTPSWWVVGDYIKNDVDNPVYLYTGSNSHYRDQGFYFSTATSTAGTNNDYVTIPHHSSLNFTDNLILIVDIVASTSTQTVPILNKYNTSTNSGYMLSLSERPATTTPDQIIFSVGNTSMSSLAAAFDGTEKVKAVFSSAEPNDMAIYYFIDGNWALQAQQNSGFPSLTTNTDNIYLGNGYDGLINDVIITSCITSFCDNGILPPIDSRFGFNAADMNETSVVGNTYSGTIAATVGEVDATYTMNRPASSNITATLGSTGNNLATAAYGYVPPNPVVIGGIGSAGYAWQVAGEPKFAKFGRFGETLFIAAEGSSFSRPAFLFGMWFIITSIIAVMFFLWTRNEIVVGLIYAVSMATGAYLEMYSMWIAIVFIVGAIGSTLMIRFRFS